MRHCDATFFLRVVRKGCAIQLASLRRGISGIPSLRDQPSRSELQRQINDLLQLRTHKPESIEVLVSARPNVLFLDDRERCELLRSLVELMQRSHAQVLKSTSDGIAPRVVAASDVLAAAIVQAGGVSYTELLNGLERLHTSGVMTPCLSEQAAEAFSVQLLCTMTDTQLAMVAVVCGPLKSARHVVFDVANELQKRIGTVQPVPLIAALSGISSARIPAADLFLASAPTVKAYFRQERVRAASIEKIALSLVTLTRAGKAYVQQCVVVPALSRALTVRLLELVSCALTAVADAAYTPDGIRRALLSDIISAAYVLAGLCGSEPYATRVLVDSLHAAVVLLSPPSIVRAECKRKLAQGAKFVPLTTDCERAIAQLNLRSLYAVHIVHLTVLANLRERIERARSKDAHLCTPLSELPYQPSAILSVQLACAAAESLARNRVSISVLQSSLFKAATRLCAAISWPTPQLEYLTNIGLRVDIALAPPHGSDSTVPGTLPVRSMAAFDAASLALHNGASGIAIEVDGPYHYAQDTGLRFVTSSHAHISPETTGISLDLMSRLRDRLLTSFGWTVVRVPLEDFAFLHQRGVKFLADYLSARPGLEMLRSSTLRPESSEVEELSVAVTSSRMSSVDTPTTLTE
jgi:hypothetical protein